MTPTTDWRLFAAFGAVLVASALVPALMLLIASRVDPREKDLASHTLEQLRCLRCGADLRREHQARCPDCGTTFTLDELWAARPTSNRPPDGTPST